MIKELWSGERYTTEELNARLKFFIGIILGLTLFGIVFVVLYSLIFVTQPMNGMSPVDNKFFELIIPIATFLTGTLSGIMLAGKDDKEAKLKAIEAATRPTTVSGNPTATPSVSAPKPFTPTFSAPTASPFAAAPVTTGFGGKLAPPAAPEPEL